MQLVTFHRTGIAFIGPSYPGCSVRGFGFVEWADICDADPDAAPPELRLRTGEVLFVPAPYREKLIAALSRAEIPTVQRPDSWALLLEPFIDTTFSDEHQRETIERLAVIGFCAREVRVIRARVQDRMLAFNAIHWDWVHLGLSDVLEAHLGWLPTVSSCVPNPRAFYGWAMAIAARCKPKPPYR